MLVLETDGVFKLQVCGYKTHILWQEGSDVLEPVLREGLLPEVLAQQTHSLMAFSPLNYS